MDWLAMLGLIAGNTFWLFLLAGDIPGTAEHECWKGKRERAAAKAES